MRKAKIRKDEKYNVITGKITRRKKKKPRKLRSDETINPITGKIRWKKNIFGI